MGSSSPVVYNPPPPPPPSTQAVSTQSLQNQTALMETSGQQQQMNMRLGAELDRANSEFFTGQNIRQTQATGAETRSTLQTQGEQDRLGTVTSGEQQRLGTVTAGEQQRLGTVTTGEQQRLGTVTAGEQERLGIGESGRQARLTQQQAQDYDKYKSQRDYEWSQRAYRA